MLLHLIGRGASASFGKSSFSLFGSAGTVPCGRLLSNGSSSGPVDAKLLLKTDANTFTTSVNRRGVILIEGDDSAKLLQGLMTNDIRHLDNYQPSFPFPDLPPFQSATPSIASCFLNTGGRIIADALIFRKNPGSYLVEVDWTVADHLISYLKKYRLRSKVEISDVSDVYTSWAFIPSPSTDASVAEYLNSRSSHLFSRDPRHPSLGYRGLINSDRAEEFMESIPPTISLVPSECYEMWRRLLGFPEGAIDLPLDKFVPMECNLDHLHHISFSKGCYVGQELTARVHYTGKIRKRLLPVLFFHKNEEQPSLEAIQSFAQDIENGWSTKILSNSLIHTDYVIEEEEPSPSPDAPPTEGEDDDKVQYFPVSSLSKDVFISDKKAGVLYSAIYNVGMAQLRLEHIKQAGDSPMRVDDFNVYPFRPSYLKPSHME